MQLTLMQVGLKERKMKSKLIALPPVIGKMDQILSTRVVIFSFQDAEPRAFDLLT